MPSATPLDDVRGAIAHLDDCLGKPILQADQVRGARQHLTDIPPGPPGPGFFEVVTRVKDYLGDWQASMTETIQSIDDDAGVALLAEESQGGGAGILIETESDPRLHFARKNLASLLP